MLNAELGMSFIIPHSSFRIKKNAIFAKKR
jgi:hypothetical protein